MKWRNDIYFVARKTEKRKSTISLPLHPEWIEFHVQSATSKREFTQFAVVVYFRRFIYMASLLSYKEIKFHRTMINKTPKLFFFSIWLFTLSEEIQGAKKFHKKLKEMLYTLHFCPCLSHYKNKRRNIQKENPMDYEPNNSFWHSILQVILSATQTRNKQPDEGPVIFFFAQRITVCSAKRIWRVCVLPVLRLLVSR